MNDSYNELIERRGKQYRYDPDYDCYYPVPVKLSTFDKYLWIVAIVLMSAVCLYTEFVVK